MWLQKYAWKCLGNDWWNLRRSTGGWIKTCNGQGRWSFSVLKSILPLTKEMLQKGEIRLTCPICTARRILFLLSLHLDCLAVAHSPRNKPKLLNQGKFKTQIETYCTHKMLIISKNRTHISTRTHKAATHRWTGRHFILTDQLLEHLQSLLMLLDCCLYCLGVLTREYLQSPVKSLNPYRNGILGLYGGERTRRRDQQA